MKQLEAEHLRGTYSQVDTSAPFFWGGLLQNVFFLARLHTGMTQNLNTPLSVHPRCGPRYVSGTRWVFVALSAPLCSALLVRTNEKFKLRMIHPSDDFTRAGFLSRLLSTTRLA